MPSSTDVYVYLRDDTLLRANPGPRSRCADRGAPADNLLRRARRVYLWGGIAMLEISEGKRGLPRHKPPFPFQVGPVRACRPHPQRRDGCSG